MIVVLNRFDMLLVYRRSLTAVFKKPYTLLYCLSPLVRRSLAMDLTYTPPVPCKVGDDITSIDTPALLLDLNTFEKNMDTLETIMKKYPMVAVRPHAKAHKCPPVAAAQMQHGLTGICCQTLVEAESLVYSKAVQDVYLTNQVIGKPKLKRFAALAQVGGCMSLCVDDAQNIKDISEVATETGVNIDCVVEVNVGQDRCGVEPGEPPVALAKLIQQLPSITFKGIHCYHGINQHVRTPSARQEAVNLVVDKTKLTLEALNRAGVQCDYVTGGGTGSFQYEAKSGVFTEVQPGSYIFMDADYHRNLDESGEPLKEFKQSLYILCTVQSITQGKRAVVDAGLKALSVDSGMPVVENRPDLSYESGGDEHGILSSDGNYKVGDLVWLIPGHCDPTVNMYNWLIGVRNNRVETVWPVLGRGPGV